jgi:hypothetical protein
VVHGIVYSFHCLFISIWGVKSTLIQLSKQESYPNKRNENNHRLPPEIITFCFMVTTPYTTSLTPLSYSPASVSHPIPLPAADRFSRSAISVSTGSPKSISQWNVRRTVPNCPQLTPTIALSVVECVWNVMAHTQKSDFVFWRNGRVHLNRRGRQFSRLLAAEVCASAVVMLDIPSSEVVWRVLATHSILHFPLHFPSRASPCAITFQTQSTNNVRLQVYPRNQISRWNRVHFESF